MCKSLKKSSLQIKISNHTNYKLFNYLFISTIVVYTICYVRIFLHGL